MAPRRSLACVLGTGALTGLVAGAAAGAIDAVWSWAPAAQFLPHVLGRLRFVVYTALSHAFAGVAIGFALAAALLVLSRATRLGDLVGFAFADHEARRARDPRVTVVGLSLVLAGIPVVGGALVVAYRSLVPFITNRHEMRLVAIVAIAATLTALAIAVPLAFVAARLVEAGLAAAVPRMRALSSVWAPFVAFGVLVAIGLGVWAWREWDTAKLLPLRAPLVAVLGVVLAIATWRPAAALYARQEQYALWKRRVAWALDLVVLLVLVLWTGGSAAVIKAESAYTGLGGPIAHTLRKAFDRDGDGYSRYLGGGDCDDSDPLVHPGAPEIPDDGIDQNCTGEDATTKRSDAELAFKGPPASLPKDFNILLVTIDTVRADHFGAYGYPQDTTPNIDALAKQATVFDNGWAHAPSTRYSMPAILTGRLPLDVYCDTPRCAIVNAGVWPGLTAKATTIAEYLRPFGFVTGSITDINYFERGRHIDQGFVEYDTENARLHVDQNGPERSRGSSSKEESDKAIAFVDRHASDRFLLWVHYYDPHADYEPHAEVPQFGACKDAKPDACHDAEALYDGEIRFTDLHLGRLFDELKAKGLYDKTVVVITGDHGEGFGEHGVPMHGYHLYTQQTKVPLIVRVPTLPARHAHTPAGHDDIIPTLVDLAGGQPGPDMMGRSLVDALTGTDVHRVVFQQLSSERGEKRGGADEHCHIIYNVSPDTSWEVYRDDPAEAHDLAADDDACTDTRKEVARWYDIETVPAGAKQALLPGMPPIANPAMCQLGESVNLLSVDAPATAKPGDTIQLQWTFAATGRVASGWVVVTHVDGPAGQSVHADHPPAWPFEWWKAGQFIRYTTALTLPHVPGRYTVKTGLWNNDQKRNIGATCAVAKVDKDHLASAATIEVRP